MTWCIDNVCELGSQWPHSQWGEHLLQSCVSAVSGSSEGAGPPHHDWQRFADHVNVKQHCLVHIVLQPTKNLNQQAVKPTADLWTLCCCQKSCFLLLPYVKKVSLHMIKIVSCVSWSKCIINAKCIVWFNKIRRYESPHASWSKCYCQVYNGNLK